jgi:hypothetical protein
MRRDPAYHLNTAIAFWYPLGPEPPDSKHWLDCCQGKALPGRKCKLSDYDIALNLLLPDI